MAWIDETKCVVCGSEKLEYYGNGMIPILRHPTIFDNAPLAVVTMFSKCECGLIFQNPHYDTESLNKFYSTGLYRQTVEGSIEDVDDDETLHQQEWATLIPPNVRHLDIGCSRGLMLEISMAKGCDVLGVEPNIGYTNFGVPVVDSIYKVKGRWDVITCKHVLEHVPDLPRFINKMIGLLKVGGTLHLEVPKEGEPGSSLRFAHQYLFSEDVIRKLFDRLTIEEYQAHPHHYFRMRKEH